MLWCCGDAVGLELRHRFIDPVACRECLFNGRRELNPEVITAVMRRYSYRTEIFVETFGRLNIDTTSLRRDLNNRGLRLLPAFARILKDPRRGLAVIAAANGVDWRMKWVAEDGLSTIDPSRTVVDDNAVAMLRNASSIVIALDNAGEAVFDVALALTLASRGYDVMLTARSLPYETDIIESEVKWLLSEAARILGLEDTVGGIRVVGTGSRYPVFAWNRVRRSLLKEVKARDVVISKGIANYEALMEYCSVAPDRVVAALAAKCPPIAGILGVKLGTPVVRAGYACRFSSVV